MELDYTCECKIISHSGALVSTRCPSCRAGVLCGVKATFTKPSAGAWKGEGRPPVNTKCLARHVNQWKVGTVIWHREDNDLDALILGEDGATTFWAHAFKPLLSKQEQERDALAALIDNSKKYGLTPDQTAHYILGAGFRKGEASHDQD